MSSTVVCNYSGADWEENSDGENACELYAALNGICDSSFSIGQVDGDSPPYMPAQNECGCNVVAYNLMAGCGWCQVDIFTDWWLTVSEWEGNCTTTTVSYSESPPPSAASLNLPAWALIIPTGTSWSPSQASRAAESATPSLTTTTTIRATTSSSTYINDGIFDTPTTDRLYTSLSPFGDDNPFLIASDDTDPGRVAGIVIGVILGLNVLAGLIIVAVYFVRQKKRKAWYGPMADYYQGAAGPQTQPFLGQPAGHDPKVNGGYNYQPPPPSSPDPAPYGGYQNPYGNQPHQTPPPAAGGYAHSASTGATPAPPGAYDGVHTPSNAPPAGYGPEGNTQSMYGPPSGGNYLPPGGPIGYRGHAEV